MFEGRPHALPHAVRPPEKTRAPLSGALVDMAEWTGLEPATPGVTGRYSNRLNYHSAFFALLRL
jgi:hypothetical protein